MSTFIPFDPAVIYGTAASVVAALVLGPVLARIVSVTTRRICCWSLVGLMVCLAGWLCRREPPGVRMIVMIVMLMSAMKVVVVSEDRTRTGSRLSIPQWIAFAAAWPGMNPAAFGHAFGVGLDGSGKLMRKGAIRFTGGLVLIAFARVAWVLTGSAALATLLLFPGLSLAVHFGLFNLLAGVWRRLGADCAVLFDAPLRARSLAEFWGRRWNLAFSEMTSLAVYRPLSSRAGRPGATLAAFLFSGVLHELAISFPVRSGYGLPLFYFLLHGGLVLVERGLARSGSAIGEKGWRGRLWLLFWLVAPLPLLFHPAFVVEVAWPIIGIEG